MGIRKDIIEEHKELLLLQSYEILDKVNLLNSLRDKALVSFLYLTGCRIEEVVKYIIERNPKRELTNKQTKKKYSAPILERIKQGNGIKKKQLIFEDDNLTIYNIRCLKRKKDNAIKRTIPILLKEKEKPFVKLIQEYIKELDREQELFPITRARAYQILSEIGLFPHYLRHLRLTHLVIDYNFSNEHLRRFTGWTSGKPTDEYVHLSAEDLLEKMRRK